MTEIVFQLVRRPDGKWRLDHKDVSYGPFKNQAAGEDAIECLRNPIVLCFNADGLLINNKETK